MNYLYPDDKTKKFIHDMFWACRKRSSYILINENKEPELKHCTLLYPGLKCHSSRIECTGYYPSAFNIEMCINYDWDKRPICKYTKQRSTS